MNLEAPNVALPPPTAARRKRVGFGVSVSPTAADQINARIASISREFGLALTRSNYFELLASYDEKHKVIEEIFAARK